jgi:hypothetical protein
VQAERATPTYRDQTNLALMLNLENLRKQAKQYLRWHRDRYFPVAAMIRKYVPRFCRFSDEEI